MTIEVSIIIPSHNKFPLNLYSLYSLEKQSFDHSKFEVIFIDDASTDKTSEKLKNYQPSFSFKYIRLENNAGRAKARNIGIQESNGSILIFLDAEMIVEPNFILFHYLKQYQHENLVVSGVMYLSYVYTCIFKEFSKQQIEEIRRIVRRNKTLYARLKKYNDKKQLDYYELITKEDIHEQTYLQLTTNKPYFTDEIVYQYGDELTDYQFPWISFLTGNISVPKKLITDAGNFDETFVYYGYEDWELGYRLYKNGAKFVGSADVVSYHQEHPVSDSKWSEAVQNYYIFITKHPDVDVLLLGLELARISDFLTLNNISSEYKLLLQTFPNQFSMLKNTFVDLLKTVALLLKIDIRHKKLLQAAGMDHETREKLFSELAELKATNQFPNLTAVLDRMINS